MFITKRDKVSYSYFFPQVSLYFFIIFLKRSFFIIKVGPSVSVRYGQIFSLIQTWSNQKVQQLYNTTSLHIFQCTHLKQCSFVLSFDFRASLLWMLSSLFLLLNVSQVNMLKMVKNTLFFQICIKMRTKRFITIPPLPNFRYFNIFTILF